MPAPRNRKHLLIPNPPASEAYTPHPKKIKQPSFPGPQNRQRHARALQRALSTAEREAQEARETLDITVHGAEPGLYIQFESPPGINLKLDSLENRKQGIELVAVQQSAEEEPAVQLATVFVPDGSLKHFFGRFQQYEVEKTNKDEPRHKDMVDRIAA